MAMATLLRLEEVSWRRSVGFSQYATIAAEAVQASRDAIEAITLFRDLTLPSEYRPTSSLGSWLDFDAHPGDCACQVRIAGLHLFARAFQEHQDQARNRLEKCLSSLKRVEELTLEAFQKLCTTNAAPSELGDGVDPKSMTLNDFFKAIGAESWFDDVAAEDEWLHNLLPGLAHSQGGDISATSPVASTIAATPPSELMESCGTARGSPSFTPSTSLTCRNQAKSSSEPFSDFVPPVNTAQPKKQTACSGVTGPQRPEVEFRANDWYFAVRWIVVCYCLGRCRQVLPSNNGRSLTYRVSVRVSCVTKLSQGLSCSSADDLQNIVMLCSLWPGACGTARGEGWLRSSLWLSQGPTSLSTQEQPSRSRLKALLRHQKAAKVKSGVLQPT